MFIILSEEGERVLTLWRLAPHARYVPILLCELMSLESGTLMSEHAPKDEEKHKP